MPVAWNMMQLGGQAGQMEGRQGPSKQSHAAARRLNIMLCTGARSVRFIRYHTALPGSDERNGRQMTRRM